MGISISKATSKEEIDAVFKGDAPHYHPDEFWDTRMHEKRVFIAYNDNQPIGLLTYTIWWGNTPFLELVHIQDKHQRQGIGSALLNEMAQEVHAKKFKKIISSCEQDNNDSHGFHDALGFKKLNSLMLPHGEEKFYCIETDSLIHSKG